MELRKVDERTKISLVDNTTKTGITYEIGGYEVDQYITLYEDGSTWESFRVGRNIEEWYLPDLEFGNDGHSKDFQIVTKAYGVLSPEEVKEVIKGYQEAIEVVRILTKEFC